MDKQIKVFLSVFAVGMISMIVLMSIIFNTIQTKENCRTNQKFWLTFQRVIASVENPPTRVGTTITAEQRTALTKYANNLRAAVGEKPNCG